MLSYSSAKAEYCGVANVVAESYWLRNLLRELHIPLSSAMLVYCDNVSVACHVLILHVLSHYQFADIFTKLMRMTVTMAQWSVANEYEDDGDNSMMVWWSLVVAAENLENKGIKQHRRDLSSDGVRKLTMALGRNRLISDLEDSIL
ncbi:ribonuclease H-like domain-containing protein [Tanacetum coccineum]